MGGCRGCLFGHRLRTLPLRQVQPNPRHQADHLRFPQVGRALFGQRQGWCFMQAPAREASRSPPVSASGPSAIWPTTRMVLHASSSPRSRQITSGFRKWAERYLANDKDGASCKLQPEKQVARAQAWHDKLLAKLAANL